LNLVRTTIAADRDQCDQDAEQVSPAGGWRASYRSILNWIPHDDSFSRGSGQRAALDVGFSISA